MQDALLKRIVDRLATLPTGSSQVRFVARLHCLSTSTVARLAEEVRTLVRTDLRKAEALARAASAIAERVGEPEAEAFALRANSNALHYLGQNGQASELNTRSALLFHNAGNTLEEGRTLSTSIRPLILLGEYDRAHKAAERAKEIFSAADDTVRMARLDINIGNIYHRQDRFSEALACYRRAHLQLAPDKDAEGIIAALHNVAVCLIALNEKEEALKAYRQVLAFCQGRNMPLTVAQVEYNIAYLFFLGGEYGRAIKQLQAAGEIAQRAGDVYHTALCRLDLSEIYLHLNLNQDASALAREACDRFNQLGMGYEAARALCTWAIALSQLHRNSQALLLYAEARSKFIEQGNHVWPSLIDLYEAFAHFNEGRYDEARLRCTAALEFFRDSALPGRAVLCHLLLTKLFLKTGEPERARTECMTALNGLTGRETPILVYEARLVMGQIEEGDGNLPEAEAHYNAAREIVENLRSGIRGDELKISFLEDKLAVYEGLAGLYLARSEAPDSRQQAWSLIEQAKSRNLLEMIVRGESPVAVDGSGDGRLATRIRTLRQKLNWYYHRIEVEQTAREAATENRLLELRGQMEEREREFLRLLRELPPDESEAAGLEQIKTASLQSVRETLGPDVALVEYFRVKERFLATVITESSLETVALTAARRIAEIMDKLQQQLSQFHLGPEHVERFTQPLLAATQRCLEELYVELIAPIRRHLDRKHLVIVPHEILHRVPFHALHDGSRHLIDAFTISYAPSASLYVQCHQAQDRQSGPALILGIADERTPYVQEELRALEAIFPAAKVFSGADANEKALRVHGPSSPLIHIAAHGFFREDHPMLSGVRMGDSYLTLYDIYSLKLSGSHVTVSGCSSGLNAIASGDEVLGLSRGLLFAGARSLLLTLWDLNDKSTATFMQLFYSYRAEHGNAALALQNAMQELRKALPHPYYWAPFIFIGMHIHRKE